MQASHKVTAAFDDPNLIGSAGLVPVMRLAEKAGLHALLGQHLSLSCPKRGREGCWGRCRDAGRRGLHRRP